MATTEEITEIRRLVNEPDTTTYSDAELATRIDGSSTMSTLAAEIWREKAASYAELVDVREGNSSRNLSQLSKQALEMATSLEAGLAAASTSVPRPARTRQIVRP